MFLHLTTLQYNRSILVNTELVNFTQDNVKNITYVHYDAYTKVAIKESLQEIIQRLITLNLL